MICHHTADLPHWPKINWDTNFDKVPYGFGGTIFQSGAIEAVASFISSEIGVRFPGLKVNIAESGGAWLPHLIERLNWCIKFSLLHRKGMARSGPHTAADAAGTLHLLDFGAGECPPTLSGALRLPQLDAGSRLPAYESPSRPRSQEIFASELSSVKADPDFVESITHTRAEEPFNFPVGVADRGV